MKKNGLLLIVFLLFTNLGYGESRIVAQWTFPKGRASDSLADEGSNSNFNKSAFNVMGGTSTITFNSTGNSTYSARTTGWDNGIGTKYWQVMFKTTGFDSLSFTSKQRSNISGPRYFKIQYKIGKLNAWKDVKDDTVKITTGSAWGQVITGLLPVACNNVDSVYLRWIVADSIAVNGTDVINSTASSSIDDIIIKGHILFPDTTPSNRPKPDPTWFTTGDTIAQWTFASSDSLADYGNIFNIGKSYISLVGSSNKATWSNGYYRATGWQEGKMLKYWQTIVNTKGYDSIVFSSMQRSNASGPKYFIVQYKLGKLGVWKSASNDTIKIETANTWDQQITDSLPKECKDRDSVFIRWIIADNKALNDTANITNSGTSGIDNIVIRGHNISGIVAPYVKKTSIISSTKIEIVFSKAVGVSAEEISNYTGLSTIQTALRSDNNSKVTLTLASALTNGKEYKINIDNIADNNGTKMILGQSFSILTNSSIPNLVITEINYSDYVVNPDNINPMFTTDSLEYIELYNNSNEDALLGGFILKHNSSFNLTKFFQFPEGTVLKGKSYLVLAKNPNIVDKFYNISGTLGWISGQGLNNNGGKLEISNTVGDIIDSLTYLTTDPWDILAKGYGYSLELCDANSDNSDGLNWKASTTSANYIDTVQIYGSPGKGCKISDPVAIVNVTSSESTVNCYPNPASTALKIVTNSSNPHEINIYNMMGVKIMEKEISGTAILDVSKWSKGMYVVSYNNSRIKLLIER